MPTEANFVRRGTVFETLIGGFGSTSLNSGNQEKQVAMLGDSSSKF